MARIRGLRPGFPGSTTCPYWCFEVQLQVVSDGSNCELPWTGRVPQSRTVSYMAWQPGVHYISQDLTVRLHPERPPNATAATNTRLLHGLPR